MQAITPTIPRHKTALRRTDLSRTAKCALRDGLIHAGAAVLDYGCGHGGDIDILRAQGVSCDGWDPVFCPDQPVHEADVVQLGYVINVIEDLGERTTTLQRAWRLCRRLLVVAQVHVEGRGRTQIEFGDGVLTDLGTFQKYFSQGEGPLGLPALGAEAVAFWPGTVAAG